ncbi:MAG TPA: SCO family protein [Desulfuromonadales bacterium]|nr:SCO family protein [Desulfuromonadales bacterium]
MTGIMVKAWLILALLYPFAAPAGAAETGSSADFSVDEHRGAKLPLNLIFNDEQGKPLSLAQLITTPTIILPVYYSCSNVCYNLQWRLARSLTQIKSRPMVDYRIISFSFDDRETPELAAKFKRVYLTSMHAPFPEDGWRFLTGDTTNINMLTEALGYHFQRRGRDFLHPVAAMIVSADGTIVRYLYGTNLLPKDLALALIEARDGTSGTTIRKMIEYCFSFDPQKNSYAFNLLRISATAIILCVGSFVAFLVWGGKRRGRNKELK